MAYSHEGELLENNRIGFGINNFSFLKGNFVFYTLRSNNSHLGEEFHLNDLLITTSDFKVSAYGLPLVSGYNNNSYEARDYFRKVNQDLYLMPRFVPEIYRISPEGKVLESIIRFDFGNRYVKEDDIIKGFDHFRAASKVNNLYFSNGEFIVTSNNWVLCAFKSFSHPILMSFINLQTGEKHIGTKLINPPKGLPFFSSPFAAFEKTAMGFLDASSLRAIKKLPNLEELVVNGAVSSELAALLSEKRDIEDQILVIYSFK
jgi:hypothetical protein